MRRAAWLSTCLIVLVLPAAPARGNTIIAWESGDELNSDNDCSLREAIQSANTDTSVDLCASGSGDDLILLLTSTTYTLALAGTDENANLTGDLDITSNVEIRGGAGTVVDGDGVDRVFHIHPGAKVTLRDFTILHGNTASVGGGIANSGQLVVDGLNVWVNHANGSGGGISSDGAGSSLRIVESDVSGNTTDANGGGIFHIGPARMQLIDTTVDGNTAGGNGGGLYVAGLDARRSTVSNNRADQNGGGLWKANGTVDDSLVDCTVSGNRADGDGGGIYVDDFAELYIGSSTVTANQADDDDIGAGSGGGLTVVGSNGLVRLANTIVADNEDGSTGTYEFYIPDCWGDVSSLGYNLFGALNPGGTVCDISGTTTGNLSGEVGSALDPRIDGLDINGGETLMHALLTDSPALDAGNPAGCLDEKGLSLGGDQRRARRVVDGPDGDSVARCDIGSYEYGAPAGIFFDDFERGTTDDWSSAVT